MMIRNIYHIDSEKEW